MDLAAGTCADDKPLVFVLDAKNKPKEEEERSRKKPKREPKSKKNGKNKVMRCPIKSCEFLTVI